MLGMMVTKKSETLEDVLAETPWLYAYLNEDCQKDKSLAKIVLEKMGAMLEYAPESISSDSDLVMLAIEHGASFWMISEELKGNKDFIIKALEWCDDVLDHVDEEFLEDLEILYKAVEIDGENYKCFIKELRDDRDIALDCVKINGQVYNSLCRTLKWDDEIMIEAIYHGLSLGDLHPKAPGLNEILDDREVIIKAIQHNGGDELRFASDTLAKDKALVEYAIDKGLMYLKDVNPEIRKDKEIVKKVMSNMTAKGVRDHEIIRNMAEIPHPLRADDDFMLELIKINAVIFSVMYGKEYHFQVEAYLLIRIPLFAKRHMKQIPRHLNIWEMQ